MISCTRDSGRRGCVDVAHGHTTQGERAERESASRPEERRAAGERCAREPMTHA